MGNISTVVELSAILVSGLLEYVWADNQLQECIEEQSGCKRCRGGICTRCAVLQHEGNCVNICPPGHIADWSTTEEYIGKICKETKYAFGFTGSQIAILVGIVSGATLCILVLLCGVIIVHKKKKETTALIQQFVNSIERKEFLENLAILRREGNTFLTILNNIRKQVRGLCDSINNENNAVEIQTYRPILYDLTRILILINKKDDKILIPPHDWQRLFLEGNRLLKQYKKQNFAEVGQLITFLEQPRVSVQLTSSQRVVYNNQNQVKELQELAVSTFHTYNTGMTLTGSTCAIEECEANELNHELNLQWKFQNTVEATNYAILTDWSPVHECCVNDFTSLGFRPQDEITTEL
ncbi:FU domain-containing protein T48 isoform X2 [Megachile rotundata]|uniref:FU domain-containing protein T48 isoform X2 n=1 Tax=Megachile rotundata TaxID=143995 RepID=UPI003FD33B0C